MSKTITKKLAIQIKAEHIQQLGLPVLRYSDDIGVLIREDGSVTLAYDHYNHDQAACLETFLAGLNAMGAHAGVFENYKA